MNQFPKIALVHCPRYAIAFPLLGIASLSAYLRSKGHTIAIFDFNIDFYHSLTESQKIDFYFGRRLETDELFEIQKTIYSNYIDNWCNAVLSANPEVVGFSVQSTSVECSLLLAKRIKEINPRIFVVFGGPSTSPNGTIEFPKIKDALESGTIDAAVIGEGELVFEKLLANLKSPEKNIGIPGVLTKGFDLSTINAGEFVSDLDVLPFPDFSDFDIPRYKRSDLFVIQGSRGCPNACVFCAERLTWSKYRRRSTQSIFSEIKFRISQGFKAFHFTDEMINVNLPELLRLCDMILENNLDIYWGGNFKAQRKISRSAFEKMKKAGCVWLTYGIESGSSRVLKHMNKGFDAKTARDNLRDSANVGIVNTVNIVVGFPGETRLDFFKTLWFLFKNRKSCPVIGGPNTCIVYSGTQLSSEAEKYGLKVFSATNWHSTKGTGYYENAIRLKAITNLIKALNLQQDYKEPYCLSNDYNEIAHYFINIGEKKKAIKFLKLYLKKKPDSSWTKEQLKNLSGA